MKIQARKFAAKNAKFAGDICPRRDGRKKNWIKGCNEIGAYCVDNEHARW